MKLRAVHLPAGALAPSTRLASEVTPELGHLARYGRLCGFDLTGRLPAPYFQVLTFTLQRSLLTGRRFPLPALGLVHTHNEMTLHRAVDFDTPLALEAWAQDLRPHRLGVAIDVCAAARLDGELVWQGRSSYLSRTSTMDGEPPPTPPTDSSGEATEAGSWQLPADLGRRYAAVSGDVNPIHLSALTAKAFGFRRAITHGMYTHARSLAALGPLLPEQFTTRVRFRRPILLPSTVIVSKQCLSLTLSSAKGDELVRTDVTVVT